MMNKLRILLFQRSISSHISNLWYRANLANCFISTNSWNDFLNRPIFCALLARLEGFQSYVDIMWCLLNYNRLPCRGSASRLDVLDHLWIFVFLYWFGLWRFGDDLFLFFVDLECPFEELELGFRFVLFLLEIYQVKQSELASFGPVWILNEISFSSFHLFWANFISC